MKKYIITIWEVATVKELIAIQLIMVDKEEDIFVMVEYVHIFQIVQGLV